MEQFGEFKHHRWDDLMKVKISLLFLSGIVNKGKHTSAHKKVASHEKT